MKRFFSLILLPILLLAGCSSSPESQLTAQERTELYRSAIQNARDQDANDAFPIITSAEDDTASFLLELMGLSAEDMSAFAISASAMNVKAYGIAAVYPAEGKDEAVKEALRGFVDRQKQNFEQYLADQYDIANNARLETLEDGTILLVMCEGQDGVFTAIRSAIEEGAKG
ncbi:MAG: DUF4358 domain-containing protein [Pseudoflavonifractor capillosus]|uniref:DUF4358 domain-containing protein n=1 Tax=Pseudoflavonifractor capillosus TaxID=106588 RepID=UPI0023F78865|nr:DUF4358 domain-containing protein [Pseudoflavonifractor capillosus]MCI5929584.1 DUF4358 domain-containing protein [Pseudoflavonifractor capillosus]MDY4662211.1 DUF4358 domain-containing protein [Pseudoflavonifractor capillosus]